MTKQKYKKKQGKRMRKLFWINHKHLKQTIIKTGFFQTDVHFFFKKFSSVSPIFVSHL